MSLKSNGKENKMKIHMFENADLAYQVLEQIGKEFENYEMFKTREPIKTLDFTEPMLIVADESLEDGLFSEYMPFIREKASEKTCPVIIFSGTDYSDKYKEWGCQEFVIKPHVHQLRNKMVKYIFDLQKYEYERRLAKLKGTT